MLVVLFSMRDAPNLRGTHDSGEMFDACLRPVSGWKTSTYDLSGLA